MISDLEHSQLADIKKSYWYHRNNIAGIIQAKEVGAYDMIAA